MDVFSSLLNVVSTLHPAVALARSLYDECHKISVNKNQCIGVVKRAVAILETVNERLKSGGGKGGSDVSKDVEVLQAQFLYIRNRMSDLASWNLFKALVRSSEIEEAIRASHLRLNDLCQCFLIVSVVNVQYNQQASEEARRQDAKALELLMAQAAHRDAELLRVLDIGQNEQKEAMRALQKMLAKVVDSVERKLMKVSLAALQRTTGQGTPKELPPWHISLYDIDVDETSNLGQGGFGVVKKATWIGRTVAIKCLASGTSQKMLVSEITVWSRLRHEHVLQFFGASETADPPFIVSCYMKNGNVLEYLSVHPTSTRALLLHQVTLGMAYLHQHRVIHGDLKGSNILVDDAGKACIADFGVAKIAREFQSRTSTIVDKKTEAAGTLRFMAPEQMRGRLVQASDVYSFGMLMYQLYTDEIPFMMVPDHLLLQVVSQERLEWPENEDAVAFGLTHELWDVLMECSDPTHAKRPTFDQLHLTMRSLADAAQSRAADVEVLTNQARFISLDDQTKTIVPHRDFEPVPPASAPVAYYLRRRHNLLQAATHSVVFSSDGKRLISVSFNKGHRGTVRIWEVNSRTVLTKMKTHEVGARSFYRSGFALSEGYYPSSFCCSADNDVADYQIWTGTSNKLVQCRAKGTIDNMAVSSDGSKFATAGLGQHLELWDVSPAEARVAHKRTLSSGWKTGFYGDRACMTFSPNGDLLVTGNIPRKGDLAIWATATGTMLRQKHVSEEKIRDLVFVEDGTKFLWAIWDWTKKEWTIHTCDASTLEGIGEPITHREADESRELYMWSVVSLAVSRDGRLIALGYVLWDVQSRRAGETRAMTSKVCILDVQTRKMVLEPVEFPSIWKASLAFSADGKRLAVGTDNGLELLEFDFS